MREQIKAMNANIYRLKNILHTKSLCPPRNLLLIKAFIYVKRFTIILLCIHFFWFDALCEKDFFRAQKEMKKVECRF